MARLFANPYLATTVGRLSIAKHRALARARGIHLADLVHDKIRHR
jgi:hypothetical protein